MSKGQPSQSTMRHDERKGPNRVRAHRSRDTGARRSCARSTPDQSPRPHPGLSDRRLRCTLGRRDRVRPLDTRGNNQPTVGRVRLVHNNRPTGVDHSSHGVPMQIASIMLRGPAEAGRQRLVGVGLFKTDSTNPWRFTDRLDPERRRRPASIDPRSRLSSFDTTTTSRDQQSNDRTPIPDRPAGEARGSAARTPSWSMAAGSHSSKTAPHHMGDWRGTSCRRLLLSDLVQ